MRIKARNPEVHPLDDFRADELAAGEGDELVNTTNSGMRSLHDRGEEGTRLEEILGRSHEPHDTLPDHLHDDALHTIPGEPVLRNAGERGNQVAQGLAGEMVARHALRNVPPEGGREGRRRGALDHDHAIRGREIDAVLTGTTTHLICVGDDEERTTGTVTETSSTTTGRLGHEENPGLEWTDGDARECVEGIEREYFYIFRKS